MLSIKEGKWKGNIDESFDLGKTDADPCKQETEHVPKDNIAIQYTL